MRRTNLERRMEATGADLEILIEAAEDSEEISERVMNEATEEANAKAAIDKATAFLLFLVVVSNVHGYT